VDDDPRRHDHRSALPAPGGRDHVRMTHPAPSHPPVAAPLGALTATGRLDLERLRADHLDELAAIFAKPEVWQFPYGRGFTRDETQHFLDTQMHREHECGFGLRLVRERATGRAVGYLGLSVPHFLPEILPAVEVGWRLDPAVWGRGYASEGATAALDDAFAVLGLDRVCSLPQVDNLASVRVAERLGLHFERTLEIPADDRRGAVVGSLFWISRDEWLGRRGDAAG
jgi:RimJ/RimL family protein N-acetyltransferase